VVAALIAAGLLGGGGGAGSVAARVGSQTITDRAVTREVAAIEGQPDYASALGAASTLALAAPVTPQALASAGGDPDDLRIDLAPAGGAASQRSYSAADLKASILTRLLYVAVVRQILAAHHLRPSAAELAEGREQARYESGETFAGTSLYDRLPSWYQAELAGRGADIEALERALVGTGGITDAQVRAAYEQRLPTDFTTVCLRSAVVATPGPGGAVPAAATLLAPGSTQARDDGCAPLGDWATDVQAAVRDVPVGHDAAPVARQGKVALLAVTGRTTSPLSAVEGNVRAVLSARYSDAVNSVVEAQMALTPVTVASQYGTYERSGPVNGVVPPDALTPPPAPGTGTTPLPARSGPQQLDPFD
jgi:hypothetical protein